MFKKLTINRMKWIELIAFCVIFVSNVLWMLLPNRLTNTRLLSAFFVIAVVIVFAICDIVYASRKDKKSQEDEMSKMNEGRADNNTLNIALIALMGLAVASDAFDIMLRSEIVLCVLSALFIVRCSMYLYFERAGISNAGIDDED